MKEAEFENYLMTDASITSKTKALRSRITKARAIEKHFEQSLDNIVSCDNSMYQTLLRIKAEMKDTNGTVSNALRKYYIFVNGKQFPSLVDYEKTKGD